MEAQALPMRTLMVVGVDLMGTVVTPKAREHYAHVVQVYVEEGRLKELQLPKRGLHKLVLGTVANLRDQILDSVEPDIFWTIVNTQFLCRVHPMRWGTNPFDSEVIERAQHIHRRIEEHSGMVEVRSSTRAALRRLKRCSVRVVVASNQTLERYQGQVAAFGLRRYFDAEYISDRSGSPDGRPTGLAMRKPQREFLTRLLEHERITPAQYVHIGNSLNNDAPFAHEARVIIVDRSHHYVTKQGQPRRAMRGRDFRFEFGGLVDARRLVIVPSLDRAARIVQATCAVTASRRSDPSLRRSD